MFKLTDKQKEAMKLIVDPDIRYILLYGGSQSAKTTLAIYVIILRALKYPRSLHLVCREKLVDVQSTILLTLFPEIISLRFSEESKSIPNFVHYHRSSPHYVEFFNASRIFFMGLDDTMYVDKILGRKFSGGLIDEASESTYSAFTKLMTRMSQKNNAKKIFIATMNPTFKKHWTHRVFIEKVEPRTGEPLSHPEQYASLVMNPVDNVDNLAPEYLDILESLPPEDKERFLYGRFSDNIVQGAVYGKEIQRAINDGKVSENVVMSPQDYIYAVFDLGICNYMAVWVVQFLKDRILFLNYYAAQNLSVIEVMSNILKMGYIIAGVYLPHDAKHRWVASGQTVQNFLEQWSACLEDKYRFWVSIVPYLRRWQGIHACRTMFSRCYFSMPNCEAGIDCLKAYRCKIDESTEIFKSEPIGDWASHGADAFRYAVGAYEHMTVPVPKEERDPSKLYFDDIVMGKR
ncbi:MAG: phage terminase large subunit [Endomicrobium sp.]|jgi:hypothetical protein|nr:phage terminase large subunit [Endomicrobium sp.]